MAALVKFLRPGGEPIYLNADQVVSVMEAPSACSTVYMASGAPSVLVDTPPDVVAEVLTSAAPGFVVNNVSISAEDPAGLEQALADAAKEQPAGEGQTPPEAT